MFVLEPALRRDIVAAGKRLSDNKLVTATHGSLSACLDNDMILCTPAGVAKGSLARDGLVKVIITSGKQVGPGKPTSALPIHTAIYGRTKAGAIVHGQPVTVSTALKAQSASLAAGEVIVTTLAGQSVLLVGGNCAKRTAEACENNQQSVGAVFVHGLGLFTWGDNLAEALARLEGMESSAVAQRKDVMEASTTNPAPSNEAELAQLVERITRNVAAAMRQDAKQPNQTPMVTDAAAPSAVPLSKDNARPAVSCTGCGRCANSGGVLPTAREQAAATALSQLSDAQLVALIAEAAQEVLTEKGLL